MAIEIGFDSVGGAEDCVPLTPDTILTPDTLLCPDGIAVVWTLGYVPVPIGFHSEADAETTFTLELGEPARIDCGDSGPPGWMAFGGEEVGNEARTLSYLLNRQGPANPDGIPGISTNWIVQPTPCCPCPVLYTDQEGTGLSFITPWGGGTGDPAPWYDAGVAESLEFLGVMITKIEGLDSVVGRAATDRGSEPGGSFLGPQRMGAREIRVEAELVATTCPGLDYGRRWLAHLLAADPCDDCGSYSLEVRTTCPPGLAPPLSDVGLMTLYDVGLTAGPKRRGDAVSRCDFLEVEWTLVAQDPWLYECPVECLPRTLWGDVGGIDFGSGSGSGDDFVPSWSCTLEAGGIVGQAGAVVEIETGSTQMDGRVVGWDLPEGFDCDQAATSLDPCYQFHFDGLPANSVLTLDGARRRLTIRLEGSDLETDALEYVVLEDDEAFDWPDSAGCLPTCISVVPKGGIADDAAVTISTRRRFLT